jgi:hypothetical protein
MRTLYFKGKNRILYFRQWILLFLFMTIPFVLKSQTEIFSNFITKFATDSVFQVSRVSFPLLYITWDEEKDEEDSILVNKEKYQYTALYYSLLEHGEAYTIFYDNFDCEFRDTGEMVFRWMGFTDMDSRYYFKRINEKWYLIKIVDYDPFVW